MKTTLGPHPDPPADLDQRKLPITLSRRAWFRIHRLAFPPVFFGRSGDSRFDAPAGEFGVLYLGRDERCAFIETFGQPTGIRAVEQAELDARGLARITPRRPLRLVNLTDKGLARLGVDARLTAGESYDVSHRWALAIHEHPQHADGILYTARHDPSRVCAAVFERAASALQVKPLGGLGEPGHARLVARLLDTYEFGLI